MNTVFVIIGPTSSGKTSLAITLSKKFNGEVVSFDSRQIYKHMDIGTGKFPVNEDKLFEISKTSKVWKLNGVNVWGYDLTIPGQYFSVHDYAKWALPKINELLKNGKRVYLAGGTGFYADVITRRKSIAQSNPNFELRKSLEKITTENLFIQLTSLNPNVAGSIDQQNRRRIIRSLEKELDKKKNYTSPLPFINNTNFKFIGLTASREFLYNRVDNWVEKIWKAGLIEETEKLISMGFENTPQLNGLIYKTVKKYLNAKISKDDAIQRIKFDLHAYIRRQQTWFKRNSEIMWFDIEDPSFGKKIENLVL